jgi:glycerol-3-phosphate dehydrogenase (NAD(P)+)
MKVAVIGAGAWGTTVASVIAENTPTTIWAREPEVAEAITSRRENPLFLGGHALHSALRATTSLDEAVDGAEVILMAVPAPFFRPVLGEATQFIPATTPIVSLVKGLEEKTLLRMTEVVVAETGIDPRLVGVLTGPNLAHEVIEGQPSATVVALGDEDWSTRLQQLFTTPRFRVYSSADVVGCEAAGALKNVIAIAAGIATGLGFGENTKAALVTRGLAEVTRLGVALGGNPLTFLGLAGNGDLFATCSSPRSRNRHVGTELGKGRSLDEVVAEMHAVAEGVRTVPSVLELARRHSIDMPISVQVDAVLYEGKQPMDAVSSLMERESKSELDGLL